MILTVGEEEEEINGRQVFLLNAQILMAHLLILVVFLFVDCRFSVTMKQSFSMLFVVVDCERRLIVLAFGCDDNNHEKNVDLSACSN